MKAIAVLFVATLAFAGCQTHRHPWDSRASRTEVALPSKEWRQIETAVDRRGEFVISEVARGKPEEVVVTIFPTKGKRYEGFVLHFRKIDGVWTELPEFEDQIIVLSPDDPYL